MGAAGSAGLDEPKEKGEGWLVFFVMEVEEPKPKPVDEGAALGASGAGAITFGVGAGADAAIFFDSSKSLTTLARCSVYCANIVPTSQNMSASIARFTDSTNAWFSPRRDVQYVRAAVESDLDSVGTGGFAGSGVGCAEAAGFSEPKPVKAVNLGV